MNAPNDLLARITFHGQRLSDLADELRAGDLVPAVRQLAADRIDDALDAIDEAIDALNPEEDLSGEHGGGYGAFCG